MIYFFLFFIETHLFAQNELSLKSLDDNSYLKITKNSFKNEDKIFILFQPGCYSCKSQIRSMSCIEKNKVVLLGTGGGEQVLKKEFIRINKGFRGYALDKNDIKKLNFKEGITPQTLVIKDNKSTLFIGERGCKEIAAYIL